MVRTAVLITEDPAFAAELGGTLSRWGWGLRRCHPGEGPEPVCRLRPALIVVDVPGRHNSADAPPWQAVKLHPESNPAPLILVSAAPTTWAGVEPSAGLPGRGWEVSVDAHLRRPIPEDQFRAAVRQALAAAAERQAAGVYWEARFTFRSAQSFLEPVVDLLTRQSFFRRLPAGDGQQLVLAVREMGTNAIEWGNGKRTDKPVTLTARVLADRVVIAIRDCGPGFNPALLPHAAGAGDPLGHYGVREGLGLREGGFGILMTRSLVDELSYNDTGNEVRLVKRFPAAAGEPVRQFDLECG